MPSCLKRLIGMFLAMEQKTLRSVNPYVENSYIVNRILYILGMFPA